MLEWIVIVSEPQEVAIVSAPLGNANQFCVRIVEQLVSVCCVVLVLVIELDVLASPEIPLEQFILLVMYPDNLLLRWDDMSIKAGFMF